MSRKLEIAYLCVFTTLDTFSDAGNKFVLALGLLERNT